MHTADKEKGAAQADAPGPIPASPARSARVHALLALQRAAGNRAVAGLVAQRFGSSASMSNPGEALEPDGPGGSYRLVQQPADTPDPTRAKIQVHSRNISALGDVGYGHAYIVTTDDRGIRRYYRGGPTRQGTLGESNWGTIRTDYGLYDPGTPDYPPGFTGPDATVTIKRGVEALGYDTGLAAEADNIEASRTTYHPTGPNSNTTARELLARNSLPEQPPQFWLPGWNDSIDAPLAPGSAPPERW